MDNTFETKILPKQPIDAAGSPRLLTAAEAAAMADNADCETNAQHMLQIVNGRIGSVSRKKLRSLERPFSANAEHGFDELVRPASDEAKRDVLERLAHDSHGYTVEVGGVLDEAVISWPAAGNLDAPQTGI